MVDMGAEVGLKMRSAVKAKLTELDCYVDDELPDYIMVMVANKRTKSQMNEDLNLFLNTKTSTFVDWLHIVLKKLKEVTVTNLEVYKKGSKRKSSELPNVKVKKEKRIKKEKLKIDNEAVVKQEKEKPMSMSLTDDLPLNVKSLSETRKIVIEAQNSIENSDQSLDVPSPSEVDQSNMKQLEEIENQIKSVKSRLGLKIDYEIEEDELKRLVESSRNKSNKQDDIAPELNSEQEILSNGRIIEIDTSKMIQAPEELITETRTVENLNHQEKDDGGDKKKEHSRITFSRSDFGSPRKSPSKKKSVLDRLGKYGENKEKSVLNRLGKYSDDKEIDKQQEGGHWKNSNLEPREDNRKSDSRSYSKRTCEREAKDSDIRRKKDFRKEQSKKMDNENLASRDNSSRTRGTEVDLRKNLSKSGFSDGLRKDLKKRLGLSSKVTVPPIDPQLLEDTFKKREVVSVVKVKPRILPPNVQQANKNLLLKAVADAQKSVAQSKSVGNNVKNDYESPKYRKSDSDEPSDDFSTKRYKSNREVKSKRISLKEKEKLKRLLSSNRESSEEIDEQEYIPKPIKRTLSNVEYVPSSMNSTQNEESNHYVEKKRQFIVTLDGIQKCNIISKTSVKDRLHGRKTPSPIIFGKSTSSNVPTKIPLRIDKTKIPDELPFVPIPMKMKERCKYFPLCRNREKCEYYHPSRNCEQFPYCKFGDKCLYIHPTCKFGTSCTRRDCPYSHASGLKQLATRITVPVVPVKLQSQTLQICKFFPNCTNISCSFFHPKSCKFGKYCKNQAVCNFTHNSVPSKSSLTWRSK